MAKLTLKVKKIAFKHPVTKQPGFVARVLTNGTVMVPKFASDVVWCTEVVLPPSVIHTSRCVTKSAMLVAVRVIADIS